MAKVLYITANPKTEEQSFGLRVGRSFLNKYSEVKPGDEVVHVDLYKEYIPEIDQDVVTGWGKLAQGQALSEDEQAKVSRLGEILDQFISADKYVFVTPMWNFSFPSRVKAFIDAIVIAGKTFTYTETGPVGLLPDKKVVHIQASGGVYSQGPTTDIDFGVNYLRFILGFIGITDVETVHVEGIAVQPDSVDSIVEKATTHAEDVAVKFAQK